MKPSTLLLLLLLAGGLLAFLAYSPADAQGPGKTEFEELEDFKSRESIPVDVSVAFPVDI